MSKFTFSHFVGGCFLNSKGVAVYKNGTHARIRIETCSGNVARHRVNGREEVIPPLVVPLDELDALQAAWSAGLHHGDARIVERAIEHLSANAD